MESTQLNCLTDRQKENLMADAATPDSTLRAAGLTARFADYGDVTQASGGIYPSFNAMCASWNPQLVKRVWISEAARLRKKRTDAVLSPHMGVGNSPYSESACEDPCLATEYLKVFANGVKEGGITPVVRCGFSAGDLRQMDEEYSDRAFHEYYMAPYANLASGTALMFPHKQFNGKYAAINTVNTNQFAHTYGKGAVFVSGAGKEAARAMLMQDNILYGSKAVELKDLSEDAVEAENLCGEACERAINFAAAAKEYREQSNAKEQVPIVTSPLDIAEQSCVLLKNADSALPLKNGMVIAASGRLSDDVNSEKFAEFFTGESGSAVSVCAGFDGSRDLSPELAKEAASAAVRADIAVVFLGVDREDAKNAAEGGSTVLPANMQGLYFEVAKVAKKVVLVVSSDYYIDLSFAHSAEAILLCPSHGKCTMQAVFNILCGKTCPSGKLTRNYYTDTDRYFNLLKNMRAGGGLKTGVFCGYRADPDRAVLYPFGYGLSYTQFRYSKLSVSGGAVKFCVSNTGTVDGCEVAQIYLSYEASAVIRPFKVLVGFIKVFLRAGETKICTVKPSESAYKVYFNGRYVKESGKCTVYVGASSDDIRLKESIEVSGESITAKDGDRSLYARSAGNIFSGGFTFGQVIQTKVKGKGLFAAGIVMAFIAVLAGLLGVVLQLSGYINLLTYETSAIAVLLSYAAFVAVTLILFLIGGVRLMSTKHKGVVVSTGESKGAELPRNKYERLFAELYGPDKYKYDDEDAYAEPEEAEENEIEKKIIIRDEFIGEYDPSVNFVTACERLNYYLSIKGIKTGLASARRIFSAMAASRVIISQNCEGFEKALAGFFGNDLYCFDLKGAPDTYSLVKGGEEEFSAVLEQAGENPDIVHLIALYGASEDGDIQAFEPFLQCAYINTRTDVHYMNEGKIESVNVPANVWFIIVPGEKGVAFTDKKLCSCAAVLAADAVATEPAEETVHPKSIGYYQFKRMLDKLINYEGNAYSLDEDHCWKKVDRFVRYLSAKSSYALDNPGCLSLERYAAVFLAGEGEQNGALDGAVACKMALPASVAMAGYDDEDGDLSSAIGNIFDEYDETQRVLNLCRHAG